MTSSHSRRKTGVAPWVRRALLGGLLLAAVSVSGGWTGFWSAEPDEDTPAHNPQRFGLGWEEGAAERRDIRQSHKVHVGQEEIECTDCHEGAKESARAGMPEMEACGDCHDEEVSEETEDRSGCLHCHTFPEPVPGCSRDGCSEETLPDIVTVMGPAPYRNLRYPSEDDPKGFSHALHAEAEIPCAACHGNIAQEGAIPFPSGKYMPKPERCIACHAKDLGHFTHQAHKELEIACNDCHEDEVEEENMPDESYRPSGLPTTTPEACKECHDPVSARCDTCHIPNTFDRAVRPMTHRGAWTEFHGGIAMFNEEGLHGQDCFTCHQRNDCVACHTTQAPRDHTNFWRTRTHGLMAGSDRERCLNCHRQDYCVRCHAETAPRTHIGNWQDRHCPWCHLDGASGPEENCRVCHRQALHISAPHTVQPSLDCRLCH